MKRIRLALLAALIVPAISGGLARAHGDENHGPPVAQSAGSSRAGGVITVPIETQFLIGLRTQRVTRGTVADSIGVAGHVNTRPDGDARIAAPLAGRLTPPPGGFPILGARVRRGQLLGTLHQTLGASEAASVSAAQQSAAFARNDARRRLAAGQSQLLLAQQNAARMRGLSGVVPARDIAAAQTAVQVAQAHVDQARRDMGVGGVGGARTSVLRAPIDGTIVLAQANSGSQIEQGTEIFRIAELSRVWIDARLSESQAAALGPGQTATITSSQDPTMRFEGRRVAVGAMIDETSRTVQAIFEVSNPDGRLRIGAAVDVAVQGGTPVDAIVVPQAALLEHEGATVVVVKTGAETFEIRGVRTGPRNAALTGIVNGLRAGERVVLAGASSVLLAAQ